MVKKRTSLDALFKAEESENEINREMKTKQPTTQVAKKIKKSEETVTENVIVKQTVYLPVQVHEQLRLLAFEERKKMHDFLVEGLDRVFKNRGLKTFSELSK